MGTMTLYKLFSMFLDQISGRVLLTHEDAKALADWADENRRGGTTAYGPKFDAAMNVAVSVRDEIGRK